MNHDDIDRILATDDEITPSPEFLASVMSAVSREASSLPPLEFPWLRALPGFLATIVAFMAAIGYGISVLSEPAAIAMLDEQLGRVTALASRSGIQWIVLAGAITAMSLALSSSLVRRMSHA